MPLVVYVDKALGARGYQTNMSEKFSFVTPGIKVMTSAVG